jgi:hypothetical protein
VHGGCDGGGGGDGSDGGGSVGGGGEGGGDGGGGDTGGVLPPSSKRERGVPTVGSARPHASDVEAAEARLASHAAASMSLRRVCQARP